jgi:hypothetical protein
MLKKIISFLTFYKFVLYYEYGEIGITSGPINYKRCMFNKKINGPEIWVFNNGVYGQIQYEQGIRVNHVIESWNKDATRWCIERAFGFMSNQGPLIKFNYGK